MIITDRTITVRKGVATINEPVVLYRGDYEVVIRFKISNSKLKFMAGANMIESEKAAYGQLAILTPYGGNIFSSMTKCSEGAVAFVVTQDMLDQIEEVGLHSFQIRLFDANRESRITIPPVEFGIEIREPIASEDHDNEVNNAIVGYSIAKVVDPSEENVGPTFDHNGQYNKTDWKTGDRISQGKLNKIEDAIDTINQNGKNLDRRITTSYNILNAELADKADISDLARLSTVTPKFANSVQEMTDTSVNYVNTTDGYLYRYNGTKFEKTSILYQSSGIEDASVTSVKLDPDTSSRGYIWDKSPQMFGFNRAINVNYTIGQYLDDGTLNPTLVKERAYSDYFMPTNNKFTLYNALNGVYKIGLITADENGVKISASSNFTDWMTKESHNWVITNNSVRKCYLNIARVDNAAMNENDLDNLVKNIMICDGEFEIDFKLRTHEGDNAYFITPYEFKIDTVNKTVACTGTYALTYGSFYINNPEFDISNLDLSSQGVFYFDLNDNKIKWMLRADLYYNTEDTSKYVVVGQSWTNNTTYGKYIKLFTDANIYVDGVRQANNGFSDRFKNKKFLFDGDSIMWGRTINGGTAKLAMPDVVSSRLGVAFDKIAVPGACVTPKDPADGQSLVERCTTNNYANYDYIIMNGGTNDYGYFREIGNIEDTDVTTFYGAWNKIIKTIYSANPKAKVVLITPIYRSYVNVSGSAIYGNTYNIENYKGYTLNDYSDAMVKIGELYNVPVLDNRKNSVVNILNYKTRLHHDGSDKYLHPNAETYVEMGHILASFIESKF